MEPPPERSSASSHDVVQLLSCSGSPTRLLRLCVAGQPYFSRNQVSHTLTHSPDKRFRNAAAAALADSTEEDEVCCSAVHASLRVVRVLTRVLATPGTTSVASQGAPVLVTTPAELLFLKAAKVVGPKSNGSSGVQARLCVLWAPQGVRRQLLTASARAAVVAGIHC